MALNLGNLITATEAKALSDDNASTIQQLKLNVHMGVMSAAKEGLLELTFRVPKSISAQAKTAIENEGYAVTEVVLPDLSYNEFTLDWSAV